MGGFGAATPKPTTLRGNRWWITNLQRKSPNNLPVSGTTSKRTNPVTGRLQITGKKHELKATQEYPVEYGQAVCAEWEARRGKRCSSGSTVARWPAVAAEQVMDNGEWALLQPDNIVSFMSGAGFVVDAQMAGHSSADTAMGQVSTLVYEYLG